jgi:hypothetical protein
MDSEQLTLTVQRFHRSRGLCLCRLGPLSQAAQARNGVAAEKVRQLGDVRRDWMA